MSEINDAEEVRTISPERALRELTFELAQQLCAAGSLRMMNPERDAELMFKAIVRAHQMGAESAARETVAVVPSQPDEGSEIKRFGVWPQGSL